MHRSRLSTIVIDCAQEAFAPGVEFWSRALGKRTYPDENPRYVTLGGRVGGDGGPFVLMQQVPAAEHAIHLDIESDDVTAEVARLEALGARVKVRIRNHVVMVAPSGHAFCVVPVYRRDFPAKASEWNAKA